MRHSAVALRAPLASLAVWYSRPVDSQLILLIAMIGAVLLVGIKLKLWWWPGRPGYEYKRVISAGAFGLLFLVAGLVGWTLSTHDAFVARTQWAEGPIWWQVAVGIALLLLAVFWARRVPGATRE